MRITTVPLEFKFLAVLDQYSDSLMKIFHTKGGVNGRTIKNIMQPISQVGTQSYTHLLVINIQFFFFLISVLYLYFFFFLRITA